MSGLVSTAKLADIAALNPPLAASLGAGGHLNGVDVTPTIARPFENEGSTSRRRTAPSTE